MSHNYCSFKSVIFAAARFWKVIFEFKSILLGVLNMSMSIIPSSHDMLFALDSLINS